MGVKKECELEEDEEIDAAKLYELQDEKMHITY